MSQGKMGWLAVATLWAAVLFSFLPGVVGAAESAPLPWQGFSEPVLGSLRAALEAYEEVRVHLAADQTLLLPVGAAQLAATLRGALEAKEGLPEEFFGVLEEAAVFAESMGETADIEAARGAFGEVSRRLLLLAVADPRLVEGWHIFKCPMAKAFDRWLQPSKELENPYMGQSMLQCGFQVELSAPSAAQPIETPGAANVPGTVEELAGEEAMVAAEMVAEEPVVEEPVLEPGIPGLTMIDVRDHKYLWREIDQLQIWESRDQISVAEFRAKAIEKTALFLGLEGTEMEQFTTVASAAVVEVKDSFQQTRRVDVDYVAAQARFPLDLEAAVARVSGLLGNKPRHQLFTPGWKEWLLRLAFGPKNAKEDREAQQAQVHQP